MKKKKKKAGLSGTEISIEKPNSLKSIGSTLGVFGSATGGIMASAFLMQQIPNIAQLPPIANKVLPGIASLALATFIGFQSKNVFVKAAAMGAGIGGVIDLANKTVGDYMPAAFKLPKLNGIGNASNYGDYPPSYFTRQVNGISTMELGEPNSIQLGANAMAIG